MLCLSFNANEKIVVDLVVLCMIVSRLEQHEDVIYGDHKAGLTQFHDLFLHD